MSLIYNLALAQKNTTYFSELSSTKYSEKISTLEKYLAPKIYIDKSSQAIYSEIVTGRNKSILSSFKDDDIIFDTLLLNKCNSILARLKKANPSYKFDTITFYINRTFAANAANYGEGTVMVNLGLFFWIDNDDELALVLAHEIAHQLLKHSENKIQKTITTLTSDEFKEEIKDIKKSNDGKYYRYKKLMKDLSVENGKHSRYKESEADSLAVFFCKTANYSIATAAKVLLKLDHVDDLFTSYKLYNLKEILPQTDIDLSFFNVKTKYKGLSNIAVTMNADKEFDSIKTHPDCIKRYEATVGKNNDTTITCCTNLNSLYKNYKERAMVETVRHLYENNTLGYCLHMCFFAIKNDYDAAFYKQIASMCFSKIYYNDKNLKRFNSVNTNANKGTNLKELQDYLFAVNNKDLETLALFYLQQNANANAEDMAFSTLTFKTLVKNQDVELNNQLFNTKFPNSKYTYLLLKKLK